jgi:hypothetical protein
MHACPPGRACPSIVRVLLMTAFVSVEQHVTVQAKPIGLVLWIYGYFVYVCLQKGTQCRERLRNELDKTGTEPNHKEIVRSHYYMQSLKATQNHPKMGCVVALWCTGRPDASWRWVLFFPALLSQKIYSVLKEADISTTSCYSNVQGPSFFFIYTLVESA